MLAQSNAPQSWLPHHWLLFGRFPPPRDGQTILTQQLLEALQGEFTFLCADSSARSPGGRVLPPGRFRFRRIPEMARYLWYIRRLAVRHPWPILYAIASGTWLGHVRDCVAFAWSIPKRLPLVVWTHNSLLSLAASPLWRRTLRRLGQRIRFLVVAGRRLAEPLRELIPEERIVTIPNFIAQDMLCTDEEVDHKLAQLQHAAELRVLFVGHMLPEKGGWELLEAAAVLHRSGIPIRLSYAGGWITEEDQRYFHRRVEELGLESRVRHYGTIANPEILRQLYLSHHIFALPTRHPTEAQPASILEALNAACAVISTEHATIPEMVHSGIHGLLLRPSPQELAAALARYWTTPGLWRTHAEAARSHFRRQFTPERIQHRWRELLQQVEEEYARACRQSAE